MEGKKDRILIVAAHPDDEVLGAGATAARLAREGHEVSIAILGEGATSRFEQRSDADTNLVQSLGEQSRRAAQILNAAEVSLHGLPDNRFDSVALLDVVKIVERLISKLAPSVVFTHHGGDLNIDHQITNRAVITATRTLAATPVRELYAFEVPSSTEWAFQQFEPIFRPNTFFEISDTLELKVTALLEYEGEARAFPHPRSSDALRAIARRWGSVAGCGAAEAFQLIRRVR
jgi:LmbE family N-acetylglucosaminyl deacetylase